MKSLYIIPDRERIKESLMLGEKYGAHFEYNDFFLPSVLDDEAVKEKLIEFYKGLPRDRSRDTMHGAFLDVTVHSSDPRIREISMLRVRQSMDVARKMGIRGVVFHTNMIANFKDKAYMDGWVEQNTCFFKHILEEYPGIYVFMENMFDFDPDALLRLAENLKEETYFGVCLDYAHAGISPTPIREWLKRLAPYIKHMHINDNDLKADLHQPIGRGKIDYIEYTRLMREYEIEESVLVEVRGIEDQMASLKYMQEQAVYPMDAPIWPAPNPSE